MNLLITCFLFGLTEALVVNENVIFHKENEVAITRSKWLFTFVIDLNPYENFLMRLAMDVENAAIVARNLVQLYDKPRQQGFLNSFIGLQKEIQALQDNWGNVIKSFIDVRTIKSRSKRALFSIIGKALHFLFGTLTSADVKKIHHNINILAQNQIEMSHVVEESLSIVNTSKVQISENRQSINKLSTSINNIQERIYNVSQVLEKQVVQLEEFVQLYLQLDLIIEEAKRTVNSAQMYMEHLQLQLNMLSLGHLSPSVITTQSLKRLFFGDEIQIPHHLTLPNDPEKELWKYYQSLTCTTILDRGMFLVVVSVPLLDRDNKFENYHVINSQLPFYDSNLTVSLQPNLVAKYKLETSALAINPERTKYMILEVDELAHCSTPLLEL